MTKGKSLEDELYKVGLFVLPLGSIVIYLYLKVIIVYLPAFPCMLYRVFGMYCPGCGGTRAVEALLEGRILLSLWYHPLVLYAVIIFGGFMLTQTLERLRFFKVKGWKFHAWYLYVALVLLIINFVGKNIMLRYFHIMM